MRIVGFMVVGAGEGKRYLERSLSQLEKFCDEVLIVANNVDAHTANMFGGCHVRFDDREWGVAQNKIKEDAMVDLGKLKPDWVIAIDADEVFDDTMTRAEFERLAGLGGAAWYFHVIDLWDSETTHRKELAFWNIRFWRYMPELGLGFENKNLHCGLAPRYAYHKGNYAPHILRHYGLMKAADRARKVARYDKYDPKAVFKSKGYYDTLRSQAPPDLYDEIVLLNEVAAEVATYKIKQINEKVMHKPQKYHYIRREDGSVIDIPDRHLAMTLKQHPTWTLIDNVDVTRSDEQLPTARGAEAPVVEADVEERGEDEDTEETQEDEPVKPAAPVEASDEEVACEKCDYIGKNKRAVSMHTSRVHKV